MRLQGIDKAMNNVDLKKLSINFIDIVDLMLKILLKMFYV